MDKKKETRKKCSGPNFLLIDLGSLTNLDQYLFNHPLVRRPLEGKVFLAEELGLTGMEVSLNKLPAGTGVPFLHRHQENEELYLFLKGRGQFQVDGEIIEIAEGTAIRVAPGGVRAWRNDSEEDLFYIVIQSKANTLSGKSIHDGLPVKGEPKW